MNKSAQVNSDNIIFRIISIQLCPLAEPVGKKSNPASTGSAHSCTLERLVYWAEDKFSKVKVRS